MKALSYEERTPGSKALFERACRHIPGGATYSIRYFEPYPLYIRRARGSRVWDVDGNEYIDFWMVHFAAILGHGYEPVVQAVRDQLQYGAHLGFCNEWEVEWSESVCKWFGAEKVKPANSGTEANMYALRLARAYTKRRKVGKVFGGWHGGSDDLHEAVSYPYDKPASLGLPSMRDVVLLPFNDLEGAAKAVRGKELACIIVEPMLGSAGAIPAQVGFLKGLREICDRTGSLLVFDEVVTGFRHPGGLQRYFGVRPDLTTLGKAVGGQYFGGAGGFCGSSEIMDLLDQTKRTKFWERSFLGGTYTGNALTMRAGHAVISELQRRKEEVYPLVDSLGERARKGIAEVFNENHFEAYVTGLGSMFGLHVTKEMPMDGESASRTKDVILHKDLFDHMVRNGVAYMTPQSPHMAISFAHTREDIDKFVALTEEFVRAYPERKSVG